MNVPSNIASITKSTLTLASLEAAKLYHTRIGAGHVGIGILSNRSEVIQIALHQLNVRAEDLIDDIRSSMPADKEHPIEAPPSTYEPVMDTVFGYAEEQADDHPISTEHLLLAFLREGNNPVAAAFAGKGVTYETLRTQLDEIHRGPT